MTKSSRFFMRRKNMDFTEFVDTDNKREYKPKALKSHDRPADTPREARPSDDVKDRALTEER